MGIRTTRTGVAPNFYDRLIADTETELLATTPSVEAAEGVALDTGLRQESLHLRPSDVRLP